MLAWLVSRGVVIWLLLGPQEWVAGDVSYFEASLDALDDVGLAGTLVEYPSPAVAVLAVPWLVAAATGLPYAVLLLIMAVLTDLAFTVVLARRSSSPLPVAVWVAGVPLLGSTAYARFDLLPGVLAGAAVLVAGVQPRLAAGLVAVATAVKLWPAALAPPLVALTRRRSAVFRVLVLTGLALALASLALGGWSRLWSPLTYQADRGLQVESVAATPAVLAWWLAPGRWSIDYAPSKAFEITGPGVDVLLAASTLASLAYVVALALGWWRAWVLRDSLTPATFVWLVLAAVTGFVVTGKVLSPQYLLWLLPLAAAGLVVADDRVLRAWTALLLLAAGLTQIVFPANYGALTIGLGAPWVPVLALAARNVLLAVLMAGAGVAAARCLGRDARARVDTFSTDS